MTPLQPEYAGARVMKIVLLVCSLAMLVLFGLGAWEENFGGQWRSLQRRYRDLLVRTADGAQHERAAASFPIELRQLYLPKLHAVDRCVSCHLGVQVSSMADAPMPFRTHSGDVLTSHPPEDFGCTICHGGQGRAATEIDAHGWMQTGEPVPHMDSRLLRGDAVLTSCGRCHTEVDPYGGQTEFYASSTVSSTKGQSPSTLDRSTLEAVLPGAEVLGKAKHLFVQSGCLGCHRYRGRGNDLGPDLTYEGDQIAHHFDFGGVHGERTVEQWHLEHFLHPAAVSPDTIMPDRGFSQEQARLLALYMMSLHRKVAPAGSIPSPIVADPAANGPVPGKTLFEMFCSACHGTTGQGDGPAAPKLADRPRDFLHEPFRYVSTIDGGPTQEDLVRTIGTGRGIEEMSQDPGFTEEEVLALADYVRSLSRAGFVERLTASLADDPDTSKEDIAEIAAERTAPGEPIEVPAPGKDFRFDLERAKQLYVANCSSCHGQEGHGDGPQELVDELGKPIHARDITKGRFRGGDEPEELFKRIRLGIPGTPMPTQDRLTDEEIWQLVHYVDHLAGRDT